MSDSNMNGEQKEQRDAVPQISARRRLSTSLRRATSLAQKGFVDEAALLVENTLSIEPENPKSLLQLAGLRRTQGRLDDAIDLARRALEVRKRDISTQQLLLQLYLEAGRYQKVIDYGKTMIRMSPRNLYARDVMGVAYLQLGMLDKALQVTNELVHLDPTDASNHFKRAVLFQQKGELGKAIREFDRVVDLDPEAEIADEAREAISWLDTFQIRQIVGLAMEDGLFRAKLVRDAEQAATERGFFLSVGGMSALKHLDLEGLLDPYSDSDPPTYH